ncbi:MAG TPA: HigA family addiction module antitoxin [Anaerolineales bacterium]|nr:HigA family addiction module antitoxin [Anaerolineales bacterium]
MKLWITVEGVDRTVRIPTHCIHPGEMLLEAFLNPMGLPQCELADAIHVPYQQVNDIVNGHRSVAPSNAFRPGKFINMSAAYWMNIQVRREMYFAQQDDVSVLKAIKPLHPA